MRGATPRLARATACAAALALAAVACGGGGDTPYGAAGGGTGVVRASWGQPPNPLEPANTTDVQSGKALRLILRGLKRYDPDTGEARDAMAESIDTDDQRTFTIRIKKGWTFHDGSKVTARSYVDAWNYGALVDNQQAGAYFFQYIEGYDKVHPEKEGARPTARTLSGLKVLDTYTFRVTLRQKFSLWPETLGYPAYAPLPRAFFRDHEAWLRKPIGNGPYRVTEYTPGKVLRLATYERYAGADKPRNDGVELRVYTDANTAYTDLQAGNLDVVDDIPANQLQHARRDLGERFLNQPAGILQTLSFPLYDRRWRGEDARKVRQGLSMAIDRQAITQRIYHGTRTPASDLTSPVLGERGGYRKGLCGRVCRYDPAQARRLIREGGGLPGGRITLTSNVDSGSHRQWMDAVCHSINKTLRDNDACVVEPVGTFATYRKRLSNKEMTGMFRAGWQMDYPLIQNFLQPLYYTDASSNDSGYHSRRVDRLIDQANAAGSREEAVAAFVQAERQVLRDLPAVPLWYQNGTAAYGQRVSDVKLDPFSAPVFTDIQVK